MFHDQGKFLQQKDLNTTFAFFNSLRIEIRTHKKKVFEPNFKKKAIYGVKRVMVVEYDVMNSNICPECGGLVQSLSLIHI